MLLTLGPDSPCGRAQLVAWMGAAGMEAWVDAVGNVHGVVNGSDPGAPATLIGSHYDTVLDGGKCVEGSGIGFKGLGLGFRVLWIRVSGF